MPEKTKKIEVWKVIVKSLEYSGENFTYHVQATSAAMAEKKALALAKIEEAIEPYVASAAFDHYIDA